MANAGGGRLTRKVEKSRIRGKFQVLLFAHPCQFLYGSDFFLPVSANFGRPGTFSYRMPSGRFLALPVSDTTFLFFEDFRSFGIYTLVIEKKRTQSGRSRPLGNPVIMDPLPARSPYPGTQAGEFSIKFLIAPVQMVDPGDIGDPLPRTETREDEGRAGTQVGGHQRGA